MDLARVLTRLRLAAQRYLKWLSIPARTFNVGSYRRENAPHPSADFFDTNNAEGERQRRAAADAAVSDMLAWFKKGGVVGILDATNSTKQRRKWVLERVAKEGIEVIFVESRCDDEELIMANIRDVKTTSPDYEGQEPEAAAQDFRDRIRNYEKVYKSINDDGDEDHLTYLKIMNVGRQVFINRIQDYLQSRVVYFLMNLHIRPRSIWLSRVSRHNSLDSWISTALPHPANRRRLTFPSTASRCLTWKAVSVATPRSPTAARNMRTSSPTWCGSLSV